MYGLLLLNINLKEMLTMSQLVNTLMKDAKEFYLGNSNHLIYEMPQSRQEMASLKLIRRIIINSLKAGVDYKECIRLYNTYMENHYSKDSKPNDEMLNIFDSAVLSQKTNGCRSLSTLESDTCTLYKSKENLPNNIPLSEIITMLEKLENSRQAYAVADFAFRAYIANLGFSSVKELENKLFPPRGEATYRKQVFEKLIKPNEDAYALIRSMVSFDTVHFIAILELLNMRREELYREEKEKHYSDESSLFSGEISSFDSLLESMEERCTSFIKHNDSKPDLNFIDDMIEKLQKFKIKNSKHNETQRESNTISSDPLA